MQVHTSSVQYFSSLSFFPVNSLSLCFKISESNSQHILNSFATRHRTRARCKFAFVLPNFDTDNAKVDIKFVGLNNLWPVSAMFQQTQLLHDVVFSGLTSATALLCLRFWDEMAKRNVFEQKLNRKFVHISIGLIFMLFWPLFSSGPQAPYWAALAPAVNIIRMIGMGFGLLESDATVKSMCRTGNPRELLKGPLYYACTITFVTIYFWRGSPIGLITICNLCAGDGIADIAGRRFGSLKLPYNKNKSYAGTCAMLLMAYFFSTLYLHYFASFGFYRVTASMLWSSFLVSLVASIVESLPISTQLDDNLTVPLSSVLAGVLLF